ncbi:MAG: nuclear transport factor 2 family protein [Halopseudomonas sp.]|uniref:nuclear transport factor 2 family protein n=1 Tax=Halopseudomonas sp. TaxID=2901191 RepID=UPI0030028204
MSSSDDFAREFADAFASLDKHNLDRLSELYAPQIHFTDPLHDVQGLDAMHQYFANLYANISELEFEFLQCSGIGEEQALLRWNMRYRHPRLAGGRRICVPGCSLIHFQHGKVDRHIDYYDAGALLYEHLPLLGQVIAWLKRRLA